MTQFEFTGNPENQPVGAFDAMAAKENLEQIFGAGSLDNLSENEFNHLADHFSFGHIS